MYIGNITTCTARSNTGTSKSLVLLCILINTLCHVFTLELAGNPTFISTKSSLLTASTSSGAAPSNIQIKQEQNPFVISESLSTLNLITRPTSILTSSHTCAVQPITRFASTRPDSSNSGRRPAYCSSRFTLSIGSGNDKNSRTKNSSFSATFAGLTGDSVTVKANHGSDESGFLSVSMEPEKRSRAPHFFLFFSVKLKDRQIQLYELDALFQNYNPDILRNENLRADLYNNAVCKPDPEIVKANHFSPGSVSHPRGSMSKSGHDLPNKPLAPIILAAEKSLGHS
ncbi:hypothetical protein RJ639_017029 [Escallonia herrerae]|uniref:Uncharacterized protein n=1 Tax=Escallonia herrerae TaxID=1293975 RepID=A0AA89AKD6_9ASTE|nr:hypothetical protein RJ639_017029 [Escallonia herrerae]